MSGSPSTPSRRPGIVDAAFWLWVLAAVMLVSGGLLLTLTQAEVHALLRGAGVSCVLAGLALGFLAGRARTGDTRFRRAAVALALALTLLLALFAVISKGLVWLIVMVLTLAGGMLMMRPSARAWFHPRGER